MTILQIFNQSIAEGPGSGEFTDHLIEIIILLAVTFLLGFWVGRIGLSKYRREAKELEDQINMHHAETQGRNDQSKEIEKLTEKIRLLEDRNTQLKQEATNNRSAITAKTALESKLATQQQLVAQLRSDLERHKKNQANFSQPAEVARTVAPKEEKTPIEKPVEPTPKKKTPKPTPPPVSNGNSDGDDLKKIEGVGPKIEQLLNDGGIKSYADLINAGSDQIKEILVAAGPQYKVHDPSTWGNQAKLASEEKWDELLQMQTELKGGKKV